MIVGWGLIIWSVVASLLLALAIHKRAIQEAAMGPCRFCGIGKGPGFFMRGEIGDYIREWLDYKPADCICDACWKSVEKVYRRRMYLLAKGW